MKKVSTFLCLLLPILIWGQNTRPIGVFLEHVPDQGRIMNELKWVVFEDDVLETDVAVYYLPEPAAWFFEGRRAFMGYRDTLLIPNSADSTQSPEDLRLARLHLGLVRFAVQAGRTENIDYIVKPATTTAYKRVKDPLRQFIFVLGANGGFKTDRFADNNPVNGEIGKETLESNFNPSFSVWRILPRRRMTFDANYTYEYKRMSFQNLSPAPGLPPSSEEASKILNFDYTWAFGLGKRFAIGTTLNHRNTHTRLTAPGTFPPTFFESTAIQTLGYAGAEFNIFPYRQFFHQYAIVGYNYRYIDLGENLQNASTIVLRHKAYLNSGLIRNWGFLQLGVSYSFGTNAIFSGYQQEWNNLAAIGINVGKGIQLELRMAQVHSKLSYDFNENSYRITNSWSSRLGLRYFFGNSGRYIVNPRFGGAFK